MEKDKSRGISHQKDKKKYKPKQYAAAAEKSFNENVPAKSKTKLHLESNWDRYEKHEEEPVLSSSTDFSLLANAPINQGSHFQFKSDRNNAVQETESSSLSSELFTLDLNLINLSVSTVPFFDRIHVDKECFSADQQLEMCKFANENKKKYQAFVESLKPQIKEELGQIIQENIIAGDLFHREILDDSEISLKEKPTGLENKILKKHSSNKSEGEVNNCSSEENKPEDDLEQWLEDILDT